MVQELDICHKIRYFTLDNASSNDTALEGIRDYLSIINISFDPQARRLRCFGHIINLVVKGFLWSMDADAFNVEINSAMQLLQKKEELIAWRKRGPMEKLHNICVWITRTPQRRDRFEEKIIQSGRSPHDASIPIVGNITR